MESHLPRTSRTRTALAFVAMAAVTAAIYWFFIRRHGETLVAPPAASTGAPRSNVSSSSTLAHVLLALAVITLMARLMGGIFRRVLGQPPVMGEIFAGLMLGPSLFGAVWPEGYAFVLPLSAVPYLGVIANVGVVLFMFLVGLELEPKLLRENTHATITISHASIIVPFLLGAALALGLYPVYSNDSVSFTVFSLFLGVSMSVTAFPVLARILTDRRAQHTRLGATALACAAVGDVLAWTLLALVAGVANAQMEGVLWTVLSVGVYAGFMYYVARPLLARAGAWEERNVGPLSRSAMAVVFVALLVSAYATEAIGIHALFGAFVLGVILPRGGQLAEQLRSRLEDVVVVLFLPTFFALTGMRTQLGLVSGAQDWMVFGLILFVAIAGKFGGSLAAARLSGIPWRQSAALGAMMNTRGLMELVVLNLGLELGVISPVVFTMLVMMALLTTFACTPALDLILGKRGFADGAEIAHADASGKRST
jgi:Kef-type K+ transport system membrane component KefB